MRNNQKEDSEFINPYRQNRRCFSKYFKNCSNLNLSSSKNSRLNQQGFLDNISRASSMKYIESQIENPTNSKSHHESEQHQAHFIITNKRKLEDFHNPELFQLVSKHIEPFQRKVQKPKKLVQKSGKSLLYEKMKQRSTSVQELQKNPRITQFTRQTFYRKASSTRQSFSSKKQKEDILHSKNNLDINTKKQPICKKTRPYKDKCSFVTYQIYFLNSRVGIDLQILAGGLKQIKFRLIMNQSDTKTFNNYWSEKIDDFIDKCLVINADGISLKVGVFNSDNLSKRKTSRVKHLEKTYSEHYESLLKRQNTKKVTKKIGHIQFCQEYSPDSIQQPIKRQIIIENLQLLSNKKQDTQKSHDQILRNLNLKEKTQQVKNPTEEGDKHQSEEQKMHLIVQQNLKEISSAKNQLENIVQAQNFTNKQEGP